MNGKEIKENRKSAKITQSQLADFLGIDQSMLAKIESGKRNITQSALEKLECLFAFPLSFANGTKEIRSRDLEDIARVNRIALNIKWMNERIV